MDKPFKPIDLSSLQTYPIASRKSKVDRADFAQPWKPEGSLEEFLGCLPNILAVRDFRAVASAIAKAHERGKSVVLAMGAHVIKVGLNPVVIDLIEQAIIKENLPFGKDSLLAASVRLQIPATVHVAIGTDIIHSHPGFDPEATGKATHLDFRLLASVVASLEDGVYMNVGSAVILPEVFLKALAVVRNMGLKAEQFTTVNMDFIRHYRPTANVVERPTSMGGVGYTLIGHHEIMFPLLAAAVIEKIGRSGR
jgi:hypothetical protein